MVTAKEAADEYRTVLSELTRNDKTQINLLTILAEDYASFSNEIVAAIGETLFTCPAAMKIVILYVVDSIIKNIPATNGGYRELFSKRIVDMIVHVFKESDERTRASIYRLRCTWADVFPRSRLYMIDTKINTIDKAWPIIHPNATITVPASTAAGSLGGGGRVVHVNPLFLNGKTASSVEQQPTKLVAIKKEQTATSHKDEASSTVSSTTPEPMGLTVTVENEKSLQKMVKKEPKDTDESAKQRQHPSEATVPSTSTNPRPTEKSRAMKDNNSNRKEPKQPKRISERSAQRRGSREERQPRRLPSLRSIRVNPPLMTPQSQPSEEPPPQKRQRHTTPPVTTQQPAPQHRPSLPPVHVQPKIVPAPSEPTTAPGIHAFGLKVVATSAQAMGTTSTPPITMNSRAPVQTPNLLPAISQPVPTNVVTQPTPYLEPPPPQQQNPAPFIPQMLPIQQHHIQNVTPRLPGVPENNRIFVDGKAYEVFYLDDVAVIERNGLPHRVSFAGPPRDVIIDGAAHRMAFGEAKQVLIDGDVHMLRFGAPSRELYMGNFAFKGAFGGPPIIATINQTRHEIRLCGPPPEVRIDPDPSYELMRYMPAIRQQQPMMQPKIEPKPDQTSINVTKLLERLKGTGLFTQKPTEAERKQREKQAALEVKNAAIASLNAPPIPANYRLENIERRAAPMSGLDQFSMRSLIIRYDSVIDSIHRPRVVCQYCGIAFQELYSEAYQRHADWHLQNTIRMEDQKLNKGPKVVKGIRSQPWYMLDDWFDYSETELVNRVQGAAGQDGGNKSDDERETASSPAQHHVGSNQDAPSEMVESKECQVCHEQFEEYWDEEEDVWRLRDCVLSDEKAFHSLCKEDAIAGGAERMERLLSERTDDGQMDEATDSDMRIGTVQLTNVQVQDGCQTNTEGQMEMDGDDQLEEGASVCVENKDEKMVDEREL